MLIFDHKNHVALWDWLSKNPTKTKRDWPDWNWRKHVSFNCYACEVGRLSRRGEVRCDCPLDWGTAWNPYSCACAQPDSPFDKWARETNLFMRSIYARQVRDLPVIWKKKV